MDVGLLRRLAEISLGRIVLCRRLPGKVGGGRIVVSGRVGGMKYLLKPAYCWDPQLVDIASILVRRGHTIWDIGANVGLFSKAAAYQAGPGGQILSVEADIDAVVLLNRTCRYNAVDQAPIIVLPVAVSKSTGFVRFAIANRARAANCIEGYGSSQTGGTSEIRTLPCVCLDNLLEHFGNPDVSKIDVEGAELDVLKGGKEILTRVRPAIYCEVTSQSNDDVTKILKTNCYRLWDGCGFNSTLHDEVSRCAFNTVAIPEEKIAEYE